MIEQAKFTCSSPEKAFEKRIKAIEDNGKQLAQTNALIKKI